MVGGVGIARLGADAGNGAGLEERAVAAAEQGGMGLEEVQQLGKAAGREAVAAADATRVFIKNMAMCRAWLVLLLFVRSHSISQYVGLPIR